MSAGAKIKWRTVLVWSSLLLNVFLFGVVVFGIGRFLVPPPPPSATHFIAHIARDLTVDQRTNYDTVVAPYLPELINHQDAFLKSVKRASALMQAETVDIDQFTAAQQAAWTSRQEISQIMQKLTQDIAAKLPTETRQALRLAPPE